MRLGQLMAFVPAPPSWAGRQGPWGKLDEFRKAFDRIVFTLIDRADVDPGLGERTDILALLLRSRRDDNRDVAAGHLRRTVDPHRRGPRNHGDSAELGV